MVWMLPPILHMLGFQKKKKKTHLFESGWAHMDRKLKQMIRRQQQPSVPLSSSQREAGGSEAVVLALRWVLSVLIAPQAEISLKGAVGTAQRGKSWVFGTSFIFHNLIWPDVGMLPQLRPWSRGSHPEMKQELLPNQTGDGSSVTFLTNSSAQH